MHMVGISCKIYNPRANAWPVHEVIFFIFKTFAVISPKVVLYSLLVGVCSKLKFVEICGFIAKINSSAKHVGKLHDGCEQDYVSLLMWCDMERQDQKQVDIP